MIFFFSSNINIFDLWNSFNTSFLSCNDRVYSIFLVIDPCWYWSDCLQCTFHFNFDYIHIFTRYFVDGYLTRILIFNCYSCDWVLWESSSEFVIKSWILGQIFFSILFLFVFVNHLSADLGTSRPVSTTHCLVEIYHCYLFCIRYPIQLYEWFSYLWRALITVSWSRVHTTKLKTEDSYIIIFTFLSLFWYDDNFIQSRPNKVQILSHLYHNNFLD